MSREIRKESAIWIALSCPATDVTKQNSWLLLIMYISTHYNVLLFGRLPSFFFFFIEGYEKEGTIMTQASAFLSLSYYIHHAEHSHAHPHIYVKAFLLVCPKFGA